MSHYPDLTGPHTVYHNMQRCSSQEYAMLTNQSGKIESNLSDSTELAPLATYNNAETYEIADTSIIIPGAVTQRILTHFIFLL